MRKLLYLSLGLLLLMACAGGASADGLLSAAEALMDERPDSAGLLLDSVDVSALNEEQSARYALLHTIAAYKNGASVGSDEAITRSLDYFTLHNDRQRCAVAYYYRGIVRLYCMEQPLTAIRDLRQAERLMGEGGATDLLNNRLVYEALAEGYSRTGDYRRAYEMTHRAVLQRQVEESQTVQRLNERIFLLMGLSVVLALLVALCLWWYRRRMERFAVIIDENAHQIAQYRCEIEQMEQSGEAGREQIAALEQKIAERQERISGKLHIGAKLYDGLRQQKSIDATAYDLQCLLDYFALLKPKCWHSWETRYEALTPRQILFLILQDDLGFGDESIGRILQLKPSAIRSVRSRIKKRER